MTPVVLLKELKKFIEFHTKDIMLPVNVNQHSGDDSRRAPDVYVSRLPERGASGKYVPYIMIQFLVGKDQQKPGQYTESECSTRVLIVTYSGDGAAGEDDVLNVIDRLRIALLEKRIIAKQFKLINQEYTLYPDDNNMYYIGDMILDWSIPTVTEQW